MSMQRLQNMLLHLPFVLLCMAAVFKELQGQPTYEDFKNRHMIGNTGLPGNTYGEKCTMGIENRRIFIKKNNQQECKPINTFIIGDEQSIKDICKSKDNILICSSRKFDIIICRKNDDGVRLVSEGCKYKGALQKRQVVVACKDGLPVHFERFC
uniref:Ribonuclease A-domain domain-containing protein n=1 Tax=Xiphophorus couchianus TaxID=32473 RepID=A0A3B5MKA8_9TELE